MESIYQIVCAVLGCSTLVTALLYYRSNRAREEIDAVGKSLKLVDELLKRITDLIAAAAVDARRNRELSDRFAQSEIHNRELSAQLLAVTQERDAARLEAEHYKNWHCRRSCDEREPPNPAIKGVKYTKPPKLNKN